MVVEVLRAICAVAWLLLFVATLGSVWRSIIGMSRHGDATWTYAFFFALHQIGYSFRWQWGWSHVPTADGDVASLAGLHVLSILIAAALLARRISFEGWRW